MTLIALDTPLIPNMPGKIRHAKRSWTALDTECDITFFHYVGTDVSAIHLLPMEWRFFKESYKCRCSATKVKEPFCCVLSRDTIFFYKNVQFFELSPDRSYFLASFSLEMFLRMFLNFSNGNLMTLKDQAKIVVVTLMNCTCWVQYKRHWPYTIRMCWKNKILPAFWFMALCNSYFLDLGK